MQGNILLKELTSEMSVDKSLVCEWEYIDIGKFGNIRLYHKVLDDGFMFYVLDFTSASGRTDSVFDSPDCEVEIVFSGYGFFDGVRHLYCHKENLHSDFDGYLYYPKIEAYIEIFSKIRELELKYCSSPEYGY